MKKIAFIVVLTLTCIIANAQSKMIIDVFRRLPPHYVYDLTVATRDSMLEGKTYYPADNDSMEILAYNYGISTYVNDYLYISMSFESGQRGYGLIEIRSFKRSIGDNLVIVSNSSGVPFAYGQNDISAFVYSKNKKLIKYEKKVFPVTDETIFIKPGTPDSMKKKILNNSNMTFDLSEDKVTLSLNSEYISQDQLLRKWLKGDHVILDWKNDHFVISKIEFEFPETTPDENEN